MKYDFDTILTQLSELLKDKECDTIEFKSALGGFPKNFWETYSAFANTQGGTIILGVKERNGEFEPNGLSDADIDKLQKDFWSGARNKNTINVCLLQQKDVEIGVVGKSKVLVFNVPAAKREQKPVHCTLDAFSGTYRRNYEGDYQCSRMEVRRMFADADISLSSLSVVLQPRYNAGDADAVLLWWRECLPKYTPSNYVYDAWVGRQSRQWRRQNPEGVGCNRLDTPIYKRKVAAQ